jgi:phosphoribosylaminoimidazole (AIR) synthetase
VSEKKVITYADAGVNIDAGNKAVELMKDSVRATYRPEVIGDLGASAACSPWAANTRIRCWFPARTVWAPN